MSRKNSQHITKNIATTSLAQLQRQELKYFLDNHVIDMLIPEFSNYLKYDRFSKNGPYEIHSLYFDTEDWQAFYTKLDGNQRRRKYRIRSYVPNPEEDENVFLEVKEKSDSTVYKRRTTLHLEAARRVAKGQPLERHSPVIEEWRYAILRNCIKPKLLNSYTRLAFVSEHFPGLRITIDRDLSFAMVGDVDFTKQTRSAYWTHGKSVIEIKFDRYVPQFVLDIIRRYNLTQTPVSKYCDSIISHFLLI